MSDRTILTNCRPEPLGSYLKSLGVLRLVGEQLDSRVRGWWEMDTFALSGVSSDQFVDFFVERYRPTPLVAPWNGGSGFWPRDQQSGIAAIESSRSERLREYADAIAEGRRIAEWVARTGRSLDKHKREVIEACRSRLPDAAVRWIDAAVVLTDEGTNWPPILGTGGNIGRLELSNNFMQRLSDVLCLRSDRRRPGPAESRRWLEAALFSDVDAPRAKGASGQFEPGAAGGANSSPFGKADSLVNPWDYVLSLEGAPMFASAAARRLGTGGQAGAGLPFMVDSTPSGYTSAAEGEESNGELWAPLWRGPASAAEIEHLLAEGRADWRRTQARTGLDMARAAASLGIDRGIDSFVRHAFLERLGQTMLAVPAGRVLVRARREVPVLAGVDGWLTRVRRAANPPAHVRAALRRADVAMMEVAGHGGPTRLQDVLVALSDVEMALGRSTSFRERAGMFGAGPVDRLPAREWLPLLDDGSPEIRIAAALASQGDEERTVRQLLRPVRRNDRGWLEWTSGPPPVPGLGVVPVTRVLAAALVRSAVEAQRVSEERSESPNEEPNNGVQIAYRWRLPARAEEVSLWVQGRLDDARIGRLLCGMLLLTWRGGAELPARATSGLSLAGTPPAWAVLAPFFHGRPVKVEGDPQPEIRLVPEGSWPSQIASNRIETTVEKALLRLRLARLDPVLRDASAIARGLSGERLAAALACPITSHGAARLLRRVVPPPID